jgi:D-alanine-D-alanine ligase-like ATP-grasp enzyme
VDIIYNEKCNQCYVLEVNSRPGLSGTTLDNYCEALIKEFNLVAK